MDRLAHKDHRPKGLKLGLGPKGHHPKKRKILKTFSPAGAEKIFLGAQPGGFRHTQKNKKKGSNVMSSDMDP